MEVLRRSSVFAAEIMDAFDRSPTDKELVAQAKALGREFVHARLLRAGLAWSAPERAALAPGSRLAEVCTVLLRLGECGPGRAGSPDCPSRAGRLGRAAALLGTAVSALARPWVTWPAAPSTSGPQSPSGAEGLAWGLPE